MPTMFGLGFSAGDLTLILAERITFDQTSLRSNLLPPFWALPTA